MIADTIAALFLFAAVVTAAPRANRTLRTA